MSNSCDPMDRSPLGSSVHGILQARILAWVAMPFFRGSSRPRDQTHVLGLLHWQAHAAATAAKSLQSCPTLCDSIDSSPPGFPVPGILQARTLEWVAISFSSAWKWKVKVKLLSHVWLLATPWTAAHQAPPSMGFSRQEYWSRVPLPSPGRLNYHIIKRKFYFSKWNTVLIVYEENLLGCRPAKKEENLLGCRPAKPTEVGLLHRGKVLD